MGIGVVLSLFLKNRKALPEDSPATSAMSATAEPGRGSS
jgi:hypothetical protein